MDWHTVHMPELRSASVVHLRHHMASRPATAPTARRDDSHMGQTGASGFAFTSPHDVQVRALLHPLHTPFNKLLTSLHTIQACNLRCFRSSYSSGNRSAKQALQKPRWPDCAATRCRLAWLPAHQPAAGVFGGIELTNGEGGLEGIPDDTPGCLADTPSWCGA